MRTRQRGGREWHEDVEFKPRILGFLCNWCCYGGADLCGVSRYQYPPSMRVIRLMCSGRVDLEFVLRAFANGNDGVFIGGCWLGECHYITEGNYDALSKMHLAKKLLEHIGVNPDRLRLEWVSAAEGIRFAEVMNDFSEPGEGARARSGSGEGIDAERAEAQARSRHGAAPLHQAGGAGEAAGAGSKTREEYEEFFASDEFDNAVRRADRATSWRSSQIMVAAAGAGRCRPGKSPRAWA